MRDALQRPASVEVSKSLVSVRSAGYLFTYVGLLLLFVVAVLTWQFARLKDWGRIGYFDGFFAPLGVALLYAGAQFRGRRPR